MPTLSRQVKGVQWSFGVRVVLVCCGRELANDDL